MRKMESVLVAGLFAYELYLTDIKDESVAESVVPVVTTVDQELCVWEDGTAVPAATQIHSIKQ